MPERPGAAWQRELAVSDLPRLRDSVVDAYVDGLTAEGMRTDAATVRYGLDGGVAVRSALTALPFERLEEPLTEDLVELMAERVVLTRYLLDLVLALP